MGTVIRHLPSILLTGLLFAFVGTPLGALVYLTIAGIAVGRPWLILDALKDFGAVLILAAMFGAVPSALTGMTAAILRLHLRSRLLLACLMVPVGAGLSALSTFVIFGFRSMSPLPEWIGLTGGISAFCCCLLLLRNWSWTT